MFEKTKINEKRGRGWPIKNIHFLFKWEGGHQGTDLLQFILKSFRMQPVANLTQSLRLEIATLEL